MYVEWSQDQYTRNNVSKRERKEKKKESSLHPSIYTPPISYTNPLLMSMITLILKLLPFFVTSDKRQVNQVEISSSLGEPSSLSSSEVNRDGGA